VPYPSPRPFDPIQRGCLTASAFLIARQGVPLPFPF
jgi:hypothetical protein